MIRRLKVPDYGFECVCDTCLAFNMTRVWVFGEGEWVSHAFRGQLEAWIESSMGVGEDDWHVGVEPDEHHCNDCKEVERAEMPTCGDCE